MQRTDHIKEVIQRFQSPFYFYDLDQFEAHIKSIKGTLHPDIKVFYATKANPMSEVLRILNKNGFGVDVASLGELQQAKTVGVKAKNLIATGPAKSKNYLASLLQAEVQTIVIESFNQLKDLNDLCLKLGRKQDVLLRVQLDWEGDKSILGGSSITPFGLGVTDWKEIDLTPYKNVSVQGLHCFQWGNMLDMKKLEAIWTHTIESCQKLALEMGFEMKVIDLGGGLGISYQDDSKLHFNEVHELLMKLKTKYELQKIWLELGRFSIAQFGSYLTKVIDVKTVRGKNLIVTEGGINHMARPALVGEAFPCEAFGGSSPSLGTSRYAVHGPLCTALDHLGEFDLPSDIKPGDWLEFKRTGAYGFTESMPHFLCHALAGEAVLYQKELMVTRAPEVNLDWMV